MKKRTGRKYERKEKKKRKGLEVKARNAWRVKIEPAGCRVSSRGAQTRGALKSSSNLTYNYSGLITIMRFSSGGVKNSPCEDRLKHIGGRGEGRKSKVMRDIYTYTL